MELLEIIATIYMALAVIVGGVYLIGYALGFLAVAFIGWFTTEGTKKRVKRELF